MKKFFVLALLTIALAGCTIPFTDITFFEGEEEEFECTLEPCFTQQTVESSLDDTELLPESIVGTNTAMLRVLEKCQVDENHFVDCFIEREHQLVTFQENYAGVVPADITIDANTTHELDCFPSVQGLEKTDFVGGSAQEFNELSEACHESAPVDWCCDYVGVK